MAAPSDVATISAPAFPEDIERVIIDVLLMPETCVPRMSLVDFMLVDRKKPACFHSVVIRQTHTDWATRIRDLFLPNARFIRLSHIRRLLEASDRVRRLAVDWNLWARFHVECDTLLLDSLYLIWDRVVPIRTPSLENLQHPATLADLTVYTPRDSALREVRFYAEDFFSFPHRPFNDVCAQLPHLKGAMSVEVAPWALKEELEEDSLFWNAKKLHANFSTAYLCTPSSALGEWLAKMEGRLSVLEHPPPRAVE
ncbi:hypothetical protein B0H17DRAFT_1329558 [Mycena rosella]|uniref:Uncharacterized protein n=1 Tax=Mycena rosella TaxID=1033263 RepID=A0AAD7DP23_MYCRO|nr:hypothetical protein B0H17DRAFT_1329558 [Mycena rosella]